MNNLQQILNSPSAASTLLMISAADLKDFTERVVEQTRLAVEEKYQPIYMTREEVMELLHISNGTFYNYLRSGKLAPLMVGEKKLFLRSDIDEAIRSGRLAKYSKK